MPLVNPPCEICGKSIWDQGHWYNRRDIKGYHVYKGAKMLTPGLTAKANIAPPAEPPIFPDVTGRVICFTCECGWESMYVLPEECYRYLAGVLIHMTENHGITIPQMKVQTF